MDLLHVEAAPCSWSISKRVITGEAAHDFHRHGTEAEYPSSENLLGPAFSRSLVLRAVKFEILLAGVGKAGAIRRPKLGRGPTGQLITGWHFWPACRACFDLRTKAAGALLQAFDRTDIDAVDGNP